MVTQILEQPPTPEEVWAKQWEQESEHDLKLRFIRLKHQQAMVRQLIRNKPLKARQRQLRKELLKMGLRMHVVQNEFQKKFRKLSHELKEIKTQLKVPGVRAGSKRRRDLRLRFVRGKHPLEDQLHQMESTLLDKTDLLKTTSHMLGYVAKQLNLGAEAFQSVESLKKSWPTHLEQEKTPTTKPKKSWSPADYRLSKGVRKETQCYRERCEDPILKQEYRIRLPNLKNQYSYFSYHLHCFFDALLDHDEWVPLDRLEEIDGWDSTAIPSHTRKEIEEYFVIYKDEVRQKHEEESEPSLSQPASPLPQELDPIPSSPDHLPPHHLSRQVSRDPSEDPHEENQHDDAPQVEVHFHEGNHPDEELPRGREVPVSHFV